MTRIGWEDVDPIILNPSSAIGDGRFEEYLNVSRVYYDSYSSRGTGYTNLVGRAPVVRDRRQRERAGDQRRSDGRRSTSYNSHRAPRTLTGLSAQGAVHGDVVERRVGVPPNGIFHGPSQPLAGDATSICVTEVIYHQ